jgi:hypothetical protein
MFADREGGSVEEDGPNDELWIAEHDPPSAEDWGAFEEDAIDEDDAQASHFDQQ